MATTHSHDALLNRGNGLLATRRVASAAQTFRILIKSFPKSAKGYSGLGAVMAGQNRFDEALSLSEFLKGKAKVLKVWNELKSGLIDTFYSTVEGVEIAWTYLKEYLSNWSGVKTAATKFTNWLKNTFEAVVDYLADKLQGLFDDSNKELQAGLKDIAAKEASGKLTHAAAEQARKALHDTFDSYDEKARQQRDADRRAAYAKAQAQADADFKGANPDLVQQAEEARKKIHDAQAANRAANDAAQKGANDSQMAALQAQVVDLKKQLDDMVKKAQEEANKKNHGGPEGPPNPDMDNLVSRISSTGTFNASAAFGLAGGDRMSQLVNHAKKTSDATQQIAKNTKAMAGNPPMAFT